VYAVFYRHSGSFYVSKLRLDSTILQNDLLAFCQDKATALPNKMVFGYFLVLGSRRGLSESPPTLLGGAQLTPQERARGQQRLELITQLIDGRLQAGQLG